MTIVRELPMQKQRYLQNSATSRGNFHVKLILTSEDLRLQDFVYIEQFKKILSLTTKRLKTTDR
jgi:hypothetical protein